MLDTSPTEPEVKDDAQPEQVATVVEPIGLTRPQIEENAKNRLNAVFGDEPIPEDPPKQEDSIPAKSDEKTEESIPESTEEKPAEEPEKKSEDEKPAEQTEESTAGDEPHFTAAELRAAVQNEWTKDELEDLYKKDPELARKTASKFLKTVNATSKLFAEAGQKLKTVPPVVPASTVTHQPKVDTNKIDMAAIEKEYEDDPIVDVLKAVVAKLESQSEPAPVVTHTIDEATQAVQQAQVEQDAAVAQQIELFFQTPDVVGMSDFYGVVPKESKDWDVLTQGQIKNRWKVIEEANLIMKGALSQGMEMPLNEAFERAHLLVTAPVREQAVRNKIKSQAVKRSKSLTLEPSSATVTTKVTTKTMDTAAANAKPKLQKLFR
jgi:hypothetical protein